MVVRFRTFSDQVRQSKSQKRGLSVRTASAEIWRSLWPAIVVLVSQRDAAPFRLTQKFLLPHNPLVTQVTWRFLRVCQRGEAGSSSHCSTSPHTSSFLHSPTQAAWKDTKEQLPPCYCCFLLSESILPLSLRSSHLEIVSPVYFRAPSGDPTLYRPLYGRR